MSMPHSAISSTILGGMEGMVRPVAMAVMMPFCFNSLSAVLALSGTVFLPRLMYSVSSMSKKMILGWGFINILWGWCKRGWVGFCAAWRD